MKKRSLNVLAEARRVLSLESKAIGIVGRRLGNSFEQAIDVLMNIRGKVIISGVGKSGIIARKVAATFSSTGTQAIYLHPLDSMHGDLGVLSREDAVILISRSGHAQELVDLIPCFRRLSVPVIGIMSSVRSSLGKACDIVIETGHIQEACPFNLAPTATTTASLALCDAMAVILLKKKGFRREDFAILHAGGALGRRLQLRVSDLMATGKQVPQIGKKHTLQQAILMMTSKNLGMTTITDSRGKLCGVLTDGDLRRIFQDERPDWKVPAYKVCTKNPKTIKPDALATQALGLMEKHQITSLVCVAEKKNVAGVIHLHEILKAGVV